MAEPLEIRPLRTPEELRACVELQEATWGVDFSERVPVAILWAAQRMGGVAAGAFDAEGRLAGFVFGLTGLEDGRPAHWSDMLAVRPELRDRGLGERLKRWQRQALLPLGVEAVYWTFDPLESRNAYLNFGRLGALASEYLRDVYEGSDSPLHRGIGTDRLVVRWTIASERVARRLSGDDPPPAPADVAAVPVVNPLARGRPWPTSAEPDLSIAADRVRVMIPADIQAVKASDLALALDWRAKTRTALEAYLARGYRVSELVRESAAVSGYVVERSSLDA